MSYPKSQWPTLTVDERKKLSRLIMRTLLPIFGVLTILGVAMLSMLN